MLWGYELSSIDPVVVPPGHQRLHKPYISARKYGSEYNKQLVGEPCSYQIVQLSN